MQFSAVQEPGQSGTMCTPEIHSVILAVQCSEVQCSAVQGPANSPRDALSLVSSHQQVPPTQVSGKDNINRDLDLARFHMFDPDMPREICLSIVRVLTVLAVEFLCLEDFVGSGKVNVEDAKSLKDREH